MNQTSITSRLVTLLIAPHDNPQHHLSPAHKAEWEVMIERLVAMQHVNEDKRRQNSRVTIPKPTRIFITQSLELQDLLQPLVSAMPDLEVIPVSSDKFDVLENTPTHQATTAMRILHNDMVKSKEYNVYVICYRWLPARLQKWGQRITHHTHNGKHFHSAPLPLAARFLTYELRMQTAEEGEPVFTPRLIQIYQIP